jgi:hypothetical protein
MESKAGYFSITVSKYVITVDYLQTYSMDSIKLLRRDKLCENGYIDEKIVYRIRDNNTNQHVSIRKLTDMYNNMVEGSMISKSKMYMFMTKEMKLSYKKPKISHIKTSEDRSMAQRLLYLKMVSGYFKEGYTIVFIDESGFNLINGKYRTWCSKNYNNQAYCSSKIQNTTLIVGCTSNIIPYYKLIRGGANGERFLDFFRFYIQM